jgi:hypothetical protein
MLTNEGNVNKFVGIKITKIDSSSIELLQLFLIDHLLQFPGLCNNSFDTDANSLLTPVVKGLLHRDLAGKPRKYKWNKYRTAVGMLSYLQNSTHPEIAMTVHQLLDFQASLCSVMRKPSCVLAAICSIHISAA